MIRKKESLESLESSLSCNTLLSRKRKSLKMSKEINHTEKDHATYNKTLKFQQKITQEQLAELRNSLKFHLEELSQLQLEVDKKKQFVDELEFKIHDLEITHEAFCKRAKLTEEFITTTRTTATTPIRANKNSMTTIQPTRTDLSPRTKPLSSTNSSTNGSNGSLSSHENVSNSCGNPIENHLTVMEWGKRKSPQTFRIFNKLIKDETHRKGRALEINPYRENKLATIADDGEIVFWSYKNNNLHLKMKVDNTVCGYDDGFRPECMLWNKMGTHLIVASRPPLQDKGSIVLIDSSKIPENLPEITPDRIQRRQMEVHEKGISAMTWAANTENKLFTAGPGSHKVILWNNIFDANSPSSVIHSVHKNEIRSLCAPRNNESIISGGLDGIITSYHIERKQSLWKIEKRKPSIEKVNCILESPTCNNLFLYSCLEKEKQHALNFFDSRMKPSDPSPIVLYWERQSRSLSQYIVPRWCPNGWHVSCGSTNGDIFLWDIRVTGNSSKKLAPSQTIRTHSNMVLQAPWHFKEKILFSLSNDRRIGIHSYL